MDVLSRRVLKALRMTAVWWSEHLQPARWCSQEERRENGNQEERLKQMLPKCWGLLRSKERGTLVWEKDPSSSFREKVTDVCE